MNPGEYDVGAWGMPAVHQPFIGARGGFKAWCPKPSMSNKFLLPVTQCGPAGSYVSSTAMRKPSIRKGQSSGLTYLAALQSGGDVGAFGRRHFADFPGKSSLCCA